MNSLTVNTGFLTFIGLGILNYPLDQCHYSLSMTFIMRQNGFSDSSFQLAWTTWNTEVSEEWGGELGVLFLCFPSWRSVSVVPCTLIAAQVLKTNRPSHQKDKFREKGEWVNIVLDSEKDGLSSQTWGKGNKVGGNGDEGLAEAYSKSSDICKREVGSEDSTQALCHSQK